MKASKAAFDGQNSLANVIRLLRLSNDMGIADLGERTGFSSSYICDVESGKKKPSRTNVKRFAEAFDIPYSTLCYFDELQSTQKLPFQKLLLKILQEMVRLETTRESLLNAEKEQKESNSPE